MEAGSQRIGFGPFEPMFTMDLEGSKIYAFLATFLDGKQHMRDLGDLGCYSTYAKAINENLTVVAYSGTHLGPRWTGRMTGTVGVAARHALRSRCTGLGENHDVRHP